MLPRRAQKSASVERIDASASSASLQLRQDGSSVERRERVLGREHGDVTRASAARASQVLTINQRHVARDHEDSLEVFQSDDDARERMARLVGLDQDRHLEGGSCVSRLATTTALSPAARAAASG